MVASTKVYGYESGKQKNLQTSTRNRFKGSAVDPEQPTQSTSSFEPPKSTQNMNTESMRPKVFVSYSHNYDQPDYKAQILALADRLRDDGIDCSVDQYEQSPIKGWQRWMLDQVDWADFVLVACSEEYDRRFRGNETDDKGKGATWEGGVIMQELYDRGANSKFIPIILNSEDSKFIPSPLGSATYYVVWNNDGYNSLYRRLTNQQETPAPVIGKVKQLPVRDRRQNTQNSSSSNPNPTSIPKQPSVEQIRQLVEDALSDDDLSNLCQDKFPKVFKQFTTGQTKDQRIRLLVEYVDRQREVPKLLNEIGLINPNAYGEFTDNLT